MLIRLRLIQFANSAYGFQFAFLLRLANSAYGSGRTVVVSVLASADMQILSLFTLPALTFTGCGQCKHTNLCHFTILALAFAGSRQCRLADIVTILAIVFAGSGQWRHADFVAVQATRVHFSWLWAT